MADFNTTDKDGVSLEEYKDTYSLISTRAGSDGKQYKQYATYQIGRDKHAEKDWPVKVTLGDRAQVVAVARWLLAEMGADVDSPSNDGQNTSANRASADVNVPEDDSAPF